MKAMQSSVRPWPLCCVLHHQLISLEKVGKSVVVKYDTAVMNEPIPGDHWRFRHDTVKMANSSLCFWARLEVTAEVWGLFFHLIPIEALSRVSKGERDKEWSQI